MSENILQSVVASLGKIVSTLYEVFVAHAGIWNLLDLKGPAQVLTSLDFGKVKAALLQLDEAQREALEAQFKASLPAVVQAKINPGVSFFEEAIDLVEDVIDEGKRVYAGALGFLVRGTQLVEKVKALFSA